MRYDNSYRSSLSLYLSFLTIRSEGDDALCSLSQAIYNSLTFLQFYSSDITSVFGTQSERSESLHPSAFDFPSENGRIYHKYHAGEYPLPNDEAEQERLNLLHEVYRLIGKYFALSSQGLYYAPLRQALHRVLDLEAGTGI